MNKRFLTIAAALSMGVALTACSGGGDEGKLGIRIFRLNLHSKSLSFA